VTAAPEGPPVSLEPHPADPHLAVLRLDRPPVNALDQSMWDLLDALTRQLHRPGPYRAVVITGGPRHFAAGADIKQLLGLTPEQFGRRNRLLQGAFHALATAPQITVAAINGYALGGGCELALAADVRVAGHRTVLGLPEITLGIIPGSGGTQRLAPLVGLARAKDLILSGRRVEAGEALRIGLVDRVVEDADVLGSAVEQALGFARGPLALSHAKRAITAGLELPIEAGLAVEADAITACFASEDAQTGLRSFLEHGPGRATFQGR
jgi:enoyl-CoA hydratase/carnithine racemase